MKLEENCIFCKIAKGDIPSNKLWETKDLLCFLDINPISKGHCLIIPKSHYEKYDDMPDEIIKTASLKAKVIIKKLKKSFNAEGYWIILDGRDIDHAHIHLIPRYKDDDADIKYIYSTNKENKELKNILEKLKF